MEFLILEGDNLSALFPQVHGLKVAGFQISSTTLFAVVTAAFVLPTVWLRDLSLLSYVSGPMALSESSPNDFHGWENCKCVENM